jgi:hypothetical protein
VDVPDGVHAIPWAALDHCFGSSDDIPELLRETAAGSEEALDTLGGYMVHQGTLYEATPYLVRFLARIAASGIGTVAILDLIGTVASRDGAGQDPDVRGKTRAALAGEMTALVPLLADPSDEVRDAAAWALPQSLAADRLVPPLHTRWGKETIPPVAAAVLRGLSFLDPAGTPALAAHALAVEDSTIRLIAAWACVAGGMPWSGDLREAALAWMVDGALMKGFRWSSWSGHPFSDLVGALAERGDPASAVELAAAALTRPAAPEVREVAMLAASRLAEISRGAAPGLIAPLASVAAGADPDASVSAIALLRELGAAAQAADELALVADAEGPGRRADWALACLVQIGDPRCVPLLARDHRHRPFALDALRAAGPPAARPPFTAVLLEEIRRCLREQLLGEEATPLLVGLIGSWGPAAAAAVPDLLAIVPRHGYSVGRALADIAGATPEAVSLLRQAAAGSAGLDAAVRLRALTGDEELLLAAIESCLAQAGHAVRRAAEAARELTPARRLVPALAAALDSATSQARPDHAECIELALALWHHSGDPAPAVEVIAGELREDATRPYYGPGAAGAAWAAAALGPAASPLIPAILPLLDSTQACSAAVQALLRIDQENHGGIPLPTLAERLLLPLGRTWSGAQMSAVKVLGEIGLPQLPAHVVARLRELATQDGRIVHSGNVQTFIRDDDQLRAAIRHLTDDTGQPAPAGPPGVRRVAGGGWRR